MNIKLALRTAAVVAVVAGCTAVLVTPELIGGTKVHASTNAALLIFGPN